MGTPDRLTNKRYKVTAYINNQTKLASSYFNIIERAVGTSDDQEEDKENLLMFLQTSPSSCKKAYFNLLQCGVSLHQEYDWLEQFEYTDWWVVNNVRWEFFTKKYGSAAAFWAKCVIWGDDLQDDVLTYL